MPDQALTELLIAVIARELIDCKHVAVGAASPIPAAAALLAQTSSPSLRVSLLGSEIDSPFTDGGRELFDCAAQGRIDAFFLSGVQIDRFANINLVGIGEYPRLTKRFSGSFGSAYLYHLVPKVILFTWSHHPKVLVDEVDFVSASGPKRRAAAGLAGAAQFTPQHIPLRTPWGLITDRCLFRFNHDEQRFYLQSLHPGQTLADVTDATGFEFGVDQPVATTKAPTRDERSTLQNTVVGRMRASYPQFVNSVWKV